MRILDVLREQEDGEEPNDVLHSDTEKIEQSTLDDIKERLEKTRGYFSVNDSAGNEISGYIVKVKYEFGIIELFANVSYTAYNRDMPNNKMPNDFPVVAIQGIFDRLSSYVDFKSLSDDILQRITFSVKDLTLFFRDKKSFRGSSLIDLLKIEPIQEQYQNLVQYTSIDSPDKIKEKYTFPEEYSIKFEEGYFEYYDRLIKRYNSIYKVLKSGHINSEHTYEIIKDPMHLIHHTSIDEFREMVNNANGGITFKKNTLKMYVHIFDSEFIIDDKPSVDVMLTDYDLYDAARKMIEKKFGHFKIKVYF